MPPADPTFVPGERLIPPVAMRLRRAVTVEKDSRQRYDRELFEFRWWQPQLHPMVT